MYGGWELIYRKSDIMYRYQVQRQISLHVSADFQPRQTTNDDSKCHVKTNVTP